MLSALGQLALAGVAYLLLLCGVALAVDRGLVPARIAKHPLVSALALGVYASSWSFYGSVGFARRQGYVFLTIYLGVTLAALVVPQVWLPVLRLARERQLSSLADLFAFRYRSPWVGPLVTLFMLAGALPYLALQIRAVSESLGVLVERPNPVLLGLGICAVLTVFTILFGARHLSPRERHDGLVAAIAFESMIKLLALLAVGVFALTHVFQGPADLSRWLDAHPEALRALYQPAREGPWSTLLLLSFSAAFLLPRQFHMAFAESDSEASLRTAAWALPLYLLLLNVLIPPILWAGTVLAPHADPDFYVLQIAAVKGAGWLQVLVFVGGLSAASAMLIVTALALGSMSLNHLVLPLWSLRARKDLYRALLGTRRTLIALIIFSGFGFFLLLQQRRGLAELGLVSFVATAQFLPGLLGVLFWRRANQAGFLAGLCGGVAVWAILLFVPLLTRAELLPQAFAVSGFFGSEKLDPWAFSTFLSLSVNGFFFTLVSVYWPAGAANEEAANACRRDAFELTTLVPRAASPAEFRDLLLPILGSAAAEQEVQRALEDLSMEATEARPVELARLRDRLEKNLSGLMGPVLARVVVDEGVRMDSRARTALADHLRSLEDQLHAARVPLRGAAAELEAARRYFRRLLEDLPLGVCAVGPDQDVTVWNRALARLSGVAAGSALGLHLAKLPAPWGETLSSFFATGETDKDELWLHSGGQPRCFALHKSLLEDSAVPLTSTIQQGGAVLLLEELTQAKSLQAQLLHQDRLASVGRLAAGVAHEVGNPLTGIDSIAQNLRHDTDPESTKERAEMILEQTRRIDAIVRSLIRFSHVGHLRPGSTRLFRGERFPLHLAVDEALRLVRLSRSARAVECEDKVPRELILEGDRQQLVQVFVNLLTNACDASRPGSKVQVRAHSDKGRAAIEVVDQGEGIPDEIRGRIFEPFFTTKAPGEGTGLGLSLVYSIVRDHHGEVSVDSAQGRGTTVTVFLPEQAQSDARGATP
ncbi:MAG: GHKL domain-containing protein [Deltaproteobacteria bacterium]|nr:GHKL domain-containing protein [Deltaproteobacteria bacterium]